MVSDQSQTLTIEEKVLFCLDSTLRKKTRCSFGELVKECFRLYPTIFALTDIPQWPDTLKLDRPLRKLRKKGIIVGNPNTYYNLTRFGKEVVKKFKTSQQERVRDVARQKATRSPTLRLLDDISRSDHFKQFTKSDKNFQPSDMRIRGLIRFTLETPNPVVVDFLIHLRDISMVVKRKDLTKFLSFYINFVKKEHK